MSRRHRRVGDRFKAVLPKCIYVTGHPEHTKEIGPGRLIATNDRVCFETMYMDNVTPRWALQFTIPIDAIQTVTCGLERRRRRRREVHSRWAWSFVNAILTWDVSSVPHEIPDPTEWPEQVRLTIAATIDGSVTWVQFAPDNAWHDDRYPPDIPAAMRQWAGQVRRWIRRVRRRLPAPS